MELTTEIVANDRTVWVNDERGCCIGRFSKTGVDVHKSFEGQLKDGKQCLACCHDLPFDESWLFFVSKMLEHHKVSVPFDLKPTYGY